MTAVAARPYLQIGYIARAHGLAGEVGVKTFDPASEALFDLDRALLRLKDGSECEMAIESIRDAAKEILIEFEGVQNRTEAERLCGATVFAFREDLPPPSEGEFFQGDLVGLEAFDEQGARLGKVEEIWANGPVPNLVIRDGANELMVPFADEFVREVSLESGRLVVRPPEFTD